MPNNFVVRWIPHCRASVCPVRRSASTWRKLVLMKWVFFSSSFFVFGAFLTARFQGAAEFLQNLDDHPQCASFFEWDVFISVFLLVDLGIASIASVILKSRWFRFVHLVAFNSSHALHICQRTDCIKPLWNIHWPLVLLKHTLTPRITVSKARHLSYPGHVLQQLCAYVLSRWLCDIQVYCQATSRVHWWPVSR
jgi:hypothetical protein